MVLADRGIVCIDEFDKMSDIDRTAIHEVMEQGRVTIAKGGIHAKLNARCSVLAAANPVYGRYDPYKSPMDNIGMQDSLLSRFDLLFVVLDQPNIEKDKKISEHVLRMHCYRDAKEEDGAPYLIDSGADRLTTHEQEKEQNENEDDECDFEVYENHEPALHGELTDENRDSSKIVTMQFMKKYVEVAKMVTPRMTKAAADMIAEEYTRLRSHEMLEQNNTARTSPVTARTLETLIRLATAHAKVRMTSTITRKDAKVAIELVQFAYFQKVLERPKASANKRKNKNADKNSRDHESEDESDDETSNKRARGGSADNNDEFDFTTSRNQTDTIQLSPKPAEEAGNEDDRKEVSTGRYDQFLNQLADFFESESAQQLDVNDICQKFSVDYDVAECKWCLDKMMEDNKIFIADDIAFLV